jgi:hypothetical protein
MALCRECRAPMPPQVGPGRRRQMCERCSPKPRFRRVVESTPLVPLDGPVRAPRGKLAAATREKLAEVGREDSPEGVAAIQAAEHLDGGQLNGAQYASLLKAYLLALESATKTVTGASSALDELRKRRDARRRGA